MVKKVFCGIAVIVMMTAFSLIFVSAVDVPTVDLIEGGPYGISRITFVNGRVLDIYQPALVTVDNSTGYVTIDKADGIPQLYNRSYIVLNKNGNYLPVQSNYMDPNYTAFNDPLTFKKCDLLRTKTGQMTFDVVYTEYSPPDSNGVVSTYDKVKHYFITDSIREELTYEGRPYTRWTFYDLGYDFRIGNEGESVNARDNMLMAFDFKLRFEDLNKTLIEGYDQCRYIDLEFNFSCIAKDLNGITFAFPMWDYQITAIVPGGKVYTLYYQDFVSSEDAWNDVHVQYDADFQWPAGTYFAVKFNVFPNGKKGFNSSTSDTPKFQTSTFAARMMLYDYGYLSLEKPSLTRDINSSIIQKRLQMGIDFQRTELDRLAEELGLSMPIVESMPSDLNLDDVDTSFFEDMIDDNSVMMSFFTNLMMISVTVAVIGFVVVGKKV